jgi:repressor LexA
MMSKIERAFYFCYLNLIDGARTMIGISDKQGEMLAFIEEFVAQQGYPPTREEIRDGLNISTKSLVNYHLEALEAAALITRIPNTPRGLKLSYKADTGRGMVKAAVDFPQLDQDEVLELTYGMVTNDSNLYAIKVDGDKITNAEVNDGDIIILQRQAHALNGELVAVRLLKQDEIRLKQYYRENGHVRLESVETDLETLIVAPDGVEVEGKVVAIIRQLDATPMI